MTHGDDSGLILPPEIAPIQIVIVPIGKGDWKSSILPEAEKCRQELSDLGIRVHLDDRETYTPGWKFSEWEMKGVPIRLEIGPKDIDKQQVVLVNRVDRGKEFVPRAGMAERIGKMIPEIQKQLLEKAMAMREEQSHEAHTLSEITETIEKKRGLVKTGWCGSGSCEVPVKEQAAATIRAILDRKDPKFKACGVCGKEAEHTVIFAKAY
jgi:prolyl-tRNA synthetase